MRQYRECVRVFEQELGVPPLEETTQLYAVIQENRLLSPPTLVSKEQEAPPAPPQTVIAPTASKPRLVEYPLVGRSAEWAALLEAYAASYVNGHWMVLQGEAGIGKTRLAEEFLTHVRAQGGTTIVARCYEGETNLAYGLFSEGLRAALSN